MTWNLKFFALVHQLVQANEFEMPDTSQFFLLSANTSIEIFYFNLKNAARCFLLSKDCIRNAGSANKGWCSG